MSEIKVGQIYKQTNKLTWRAWEKDIFVVTFVTFHVHAVDTDGITSIVGLDWVKKDCKLIAEYSTWQEAVNSKEFNNGN